MKRARLARFLVVGAVLVVVVAGSLRLLRGPRSVTFNVTVETERVRYVTVDTRPGAIGFTDKTTSPRRLWRLDSVQIHDADGGRRTAFSGFFDPADSLDVLIERVATGPLYVNVSLAKKSGGATRSVGRLLDPAETFVRRLGPRLTFFVPELAQRADAGRTVILPVTGLVETGLDMGTFAGGTTAILRSGQVTMVGTSILDGSIFEAGRVELNAGDQFVSEELASPSLGFVVADQRPGLTAAYRTVAKRGWVARPGGGKYKVRVSLFDQIFRDYLFQVLAALLAGIALVASIVTSVMDGIEFASKTRRRRRKRGSQPDPASARIPVGGGEVSGSGASPSSDRAGSALKGALVLLLMISTVGEAQTGVFIDAGEHGQGLLRRRLETCFVILPHHVVENAGGDVGVIGEGRLEGVAAMERSFAGDLAMLRVRGGDLQCTEWTPSAWTSILRQVGVPLDALARVPVHLRIIEQTGSENRRQVEIRSMNEESITIRPRTAADQISQTMSGAALMAGDAVLGLLLRVCPNPAPRGDPCTPGDGHVLRLESVTRLTDGFFIVPSTAAQQQKQTEARVVAEGRRQYDSMLVAREELQKKLHAELQQRSDSQSMAARGGRGADLPRLRRDVSELRLFGWPKHITFPCGVTCEGRFYPADTPGPYLYAAIQLSQPVLSGPPPLPPILAHCSLRSSTGRVRDFVLRKEHEQLSALGTGAAWADRSRPLPPGEYWAECKVDGLDFESNRIRLLGATSLVGDIDLGDGRTADVKSVELVVGGARVAQWHLPLDSVPRVTIPRPRRPDAPIDIVYEIHQITGQPLDTLPPLFLRRIGCVAEFTVRESVTVDRIREGAWRLTQTIEPFGSRWQPGEYPANCQRPGVSLVRFVLEIR